MLSLVLNTILSIFIVIEGVINNMEMNNTKMEEGEETSSSKKEEDGDGKENNEMTLLSGDRLHSYPSPCLSPNSTLKLGK